MNAQERYDKVRHPSRNAPNLRSSRFPYERELTNARTVANRSGVLVVV